MKERISEIPVANTPDKPPQTGLTEEQLQKLEGMTREELITLCHRFACQCGTVAMMTDEQTAQAMLDILAETALKPVLYGTSMKADIASRLTAVERWLDRKKGKPVGTSPLVQIANAGDLNVMIRLVDSAGNVEVIEG
jgi:hypothetical protein